VAVDWVETVHQEGHLILSRVTQLGTLRLLNNPSVMGGDVQNGTEVWKTWDALLEDERFRYVDEPEEFEARFRQLTRTLAYQPKRWQDAYLAAFALEEDLELVTFDTGFRSIDGLASRILGSDPLPAPGMPKRAREA
jgi:predicted nucleic acid-binding protein